MKKRFVILAFLISGLTILPLDGQEIDPLKSNLTYDFRALAATADNRGYDVQSYHFDWVFDPDSSSVRGWARVQAKSTTSTLRLMQLDLSGAMVVSRVIQNSLPLTFSQSNGALDITLDRAYSSGQTFEVEIGYQGVPTQSLNFTQHSGQPIIYSLDEPIGARDWFPCHDVPDDKATAEIRITVPGDMVAASNGHLTETALNADGTRTYTWEENYPVSTYLLFVAATNYTLLQDTYASAWGNMDVVHYVYPELAGQAQEDFNRTVSMIAFFSRLFGEYPFFHEKYGHGTSDQNFWNILGAYRQRFGAGNALTADFIAVCEQVSGQSLDWFFSEWIYGAGLPTYEFGWGRLPGTNTARVVINQVQQGLPLFRMPVELEFVFGDGSTERQTVVVDQARHRFDFNLSRPLAEVRLDPDSWILCHQTQYAKQAKRGS